MLVLEEILNQILPFTAQEQKSVDFIEVSEILSGNGGGGQFNISPKLCLRMWENLKKKLKDLYKRDNEFQALCRNEVNVDFWTETMVMFKSRV